MIKAGRLNGPNCSPELVVPLPLTNLSKSYHFANTLAQNKCIRQSSTDSVTYIKTQMYDNTWFVSPLYILRCGCLVYRLEKLTLAKIDLKNRKSMFNVFRQSFVYIIHNLFPYFDASNSPKLYCFEITHTISSVTPFLNLA